MVVIPEPDDRLGKIVLIAECAQARRTQHKILARSRIEPQPAAGEDTKEVSAGKQKHGSRDGSDALDDAVRPLANLGWRFPIWTTVAEDLPVRAFFKNLGQHQPLIFAVVPLHEVGKLFRDGSKSRQFTGSGGALQWAGKNLRKCHALQALPKLLGVPLAVFRQRQIDAARVLARVRPCCVAMPSQVYHWKCFAHKVILLKMLDPIADFARLLQPALPTSTGACASFQHSAAMAQSSSARITRMCTRESAVAISQSREGC